MLKRFHPFKVVDSNKYELYLSFIIVVTGFCYSAVRPQQLHHVLVEAASFLVGLSCALNALADSKRMHVVERVIAFPWFAFMFLITAWFIWSEAQWGIRAAAYVWPNP